MNTAGRGGVAISSRGPRAKINQRRAQRGYALLLLVFLASILLVSTMAVAPSILTEGKREKEEEMIWRGKQYTRAIKLYYRKMGKFPTSMDDLTKPKTGSLRFLRQAYKDPMNKEDGSWRLIYVGPGGQLIGSLKKGQNIQIPSAPGLGVPAAAVAGRTLQSAGGNSTPLGLGTAVGAPSTTATGTASTGGTAAPTDANGTTTGEGDSPDGSLVASVDTPVIIGGNIIGVGSKINKRSVKVYDNAKNYRLFEFIWDPSKDTIGIGQPGTAGTPGPGQNPAGQNPFGQTPSAPPPNPNGPGSQDTPRATPNPEPQPQP